MKVMMLALSLIQEIFQNSGLVELPTVTYIGRLRLKSIRLLMLVIIYSRHFEIHFGHDLHFKERLFQYRFLDRISTS